MTTFSFTEEFSFSEAKSHLADIANISIEDLETLNALEDQIDLDEIKKALADVKKRGTISLDAIKRKHNLLYVSAQDGFLA